MWRTAIAALLLVTSTASCATARAEPNCRDGKRLADVAVILQSDLSLEEQADFSAHHFNPGSDAIGAVRDYITADVLPVVYLFTEQELSPRAKRSVRAWAQRFDEVERVLFDQVPEDAVVPSGDC